MKTITLLISFFLMVTTGLVQAQTQQKLEMKLDSIGNAKLTLAMTLNAQQWQIWNNSLGNNPAALKREMERTMPTYFLENFKLEKDDMNRSFTLTLKALGVCKIDKRGQWTLETGQKNAHVTELTDKKFMLVTSPPEFGGMIQQTYVIEFPQEAKEVKLDKDSFGQSVFTFKMKGPKGGSWGWMRLTGLLLLVVGGGWTGKNLFTKK